MHQVAPRVVLGARWWDEVRRAAYASTGWHCVACGRYKKDLVPPWLEGHEIYDIDYLLGRMTFVEVVPLCQTCHCFIHSGRLEALRDRGEITKERYDEVMAHGLKVLKDAGLKKPEQYAGPMADWQDWRLVVNGRQFPPKFKDYNAWLKHFDPVEVEE